MLTIAIVLFPDAEELDWAGPWEVLGFWSLHFPSDEVSVRTVAPSLDPVRCAKGLRVLPDETWDSLGPVDVLVFPGGMGTRRLLNDEPLLERLRGLHAAGTLMTSVCTGSLVYAAAGLLRDLPATTHWAAFDELTRADPSIKPDPDSRFVDTGQVITAAGVSAGIDMALHLVARLHSPDRAREVRRGIQYDPDPPV